MLDRDDSDFEVFLTISEYRKYQGLQKELEEERENSRKEKAALADKVKLLEDGIAQVRKELAERNEAINHITVECLRTKSELMLLKKERTSQELVWEKSKVAQMEQLERSTVDKLIVEKKGQEMQQRLETAEAEYRALTEAMDRVTLSSKMMETAFRNDLKVESDKATCTIEQLTKTLKEREAKCRQQHITLASCKQQVEKQAQIVEKLKQELKVFGIEKIALAEANSLLQAEHYKLRDGLERMKQQKLTHERQLVETCNMAGQLQTAIAQSKQTQASLLKENERLTMTLVEREKSFAQESKQTISKVSQLEGKLSSMKGALKAAEERLIEKQEKLKVAELHTLQKENEATDRNKYSEAIGKLLSKHSTNQSYSELKQQIEGLVILEQEYENIIDQERKRVTELTEKNSQLQNQLEVSEARLKVNREREENRQLQMSQLTKSVIHSSQLLDDMKDKETDKDVELMVAKEQIEQLKQRLRTLQVQMRDSEDNYEMKLKQLRHNVSSSASKDDEIKVLKDLIGNPKEYFNHYFSELSHNLKSIEPSQLNTMLNSEIDDLMKVLADYRPQKRHLPHQWGMPSFP